MADAYGGIVRHWRCHVAAWVVGQTDTQCTVRMQVRFQSIRWGYQVYGNGTVSGGGQSASSGRVMCSSPYGGSVDQTLAGKDFTVARKGSAQTVEVTGSVSVTGGYHNGTSRATVRVTVPAIVHKAPRDPKGFTATRVSDTRVEMAWTGDYTDGNGFYPWSGLHLYRAVDDGPFAKLCDLVWSATSYTDSTCVKGHSYRYLLKAWNDKGESGGVMSDIIRMTPAALSALDVSKASADSVMLVIPNPPAYFDSIEFQRKETGGDFSSISPSQAEGSWLDSGVPEKVLTYRARVVYGGLYGDWVVSDPIATVAAPLAPGVDALDAVYANGSTVYVTWTPNHPDKTAQSAAQVEVTVGTGDAQVIDVEGSATACAYKAATDGTVRVRVRTHGLYDGWGEWSAYAAFTVATPPAASFTSPAADGDTVKGLPLAVAWRVEDATGVSAQELKVSEAFSGTVLSDSAPGASDRSAEFGVSSGIRDGGDYTLSLTVRGGSGLESTAKRRFTAKWTPPDAPSVKVETDAGFSAYVTVTAAATGEVATDHLRLIRVNPDGTTSALGDALKSGDTVPDRLPPVNTPFTYRVAAVALTGAVSYTDHGCTVDSGGCEVYSFGAAATDSISLGLSLDASSSIELSGETFEFAGQSLPRFYADGRRSSSVSRSYDVMTLEEADRVKALAETYPKCWFRDVFGHVRFGYAKWSTSYSASKANFYGVSVSFTELEWEDPVNG